MTSPAEGSTFLFRRRDAWELQKELIACVIKCLSYPVEVHAVFHGSAMALVLRDVSFNGAVFLEGP
jgi:hypothetical protein